MALPMLFELLEEYAPQWYTQEPSVITSKPANGDQVKTGQRERPGQELFYSAESFGGKFVFVRQLRGPHLSTCA
jgi:hypothetical protein